MLENDFARNGRQFFLYLTCVWIVLLPSPKLLLLCLLLILSSWFDVWASEPAHNNHDEWIGYEYILLRRQVNQSNSNCVFEAVNSIKVKRYSSDWLHDTYFIKMRMKKREKTKLTKNGEQSHHPNSLDSGFWNWWKREKRGEWNVFHFSVKIVINNCNRFEWNEPTTTTTAIMTTVWF